MLRALLRRYGILPLTLAITGLAILASVVLTVVIASLLGAPPGAFGLAMSIAVPALVAPFFTFLFLRLLDELWRAEARLQALATTDELTQACNRRHFLQLVAQELTRAERYGGVFSLALLDLDDFKSINDRYGHQAGDEVLRRVSAVSRAALRAGDAFARYGGEEFAVLLQSAGAPAAHEAVERLRRQLSETVVDAAGQSIACTLSAGVVTCDLRPAARVASTAEPLTIDQLLQRADEALYAAKRAGGNTVVAA